MSTWIILILASGFALYMAVSLHKTWIIFATAFATLLGLVMLIMRILLIRKMKKGTIRR